MENPSSALTEYIDPSVVYTCVGFLLVVLLEFVVVGLGLTDGCLVSRDSSQSVSDSDSEEESDVVTLLYCALALDRLRRPFPRKWG